MTTKKNSKKSSKPQYVIVRCTGAGCHAGELVSAKDGTVVLKNSRRIWRWRGAQTLSELAVYGATGPNQAESQIAPLVADITLFGAHEVIVCKPAGEAWFRAAKEWRC